MARILVIEDDETTLDTYGRMLEAAGHTVRLVPTARQGRNEALGSRYDLLLADLFLPDGTAIELLQAIRRADVKVPLMKTNAEWARLVGVSTTTLRDWCRMARTSAAQSLTLARFLRVVHRSRGGGWHPARHLTASDPRTMARLIERSGLPAEAASVTAHDLLLAQGFVNDGDALLALREALGRFDASSDVV